MERNREDKEVRKEGRNETERRRRAAGTQGPERAVWEEGGGGMAGERRTWRWNGEGGHGRKKRRDSERERERERGRARERESVRDALSKLAKGHMREAVM